MLKKLVAYDTWHLQITAINTGICAFDTNCKPGCILFFDLEQVLAEVQFVVNSIVIVYE